MSEHKMGKMLKRADYIKTNLLGRKREVFEEEIEEVMEIVTSNTDLITETLEEREELIEACLELYDSSSSSLNGLRKDFHRLFLDYAFKNSLPSPFISLDASQPWLLYWIGNSLKIMNPDWLMEDYQTRIIEKLWKISPTGGPFSGGKEQLPHLTANYAAINSLALCHELGEGREINRKAIHKWLLSLKTNEGGFSTVSPVGEQDVRGVYAALSVASLLGILDEDIKVGVKEFLINCQSAEGGFGGCPDDEAHGGYTFCAVASLAILNELDAVDINGLLRWCSARQVKEERGLNGRSNKLVDGCYSFWIGGTAAILEAYGYGMCIDKHALQQYILRCCQTETSPGLRDKPGKNPDYYHTNYVLAGLSICEYSFSNKTKSPLSISATPINQDVTIQPINPIYGLTIADVQSFFSRQALDISGLRIGK